MTPFASPICQKQIKENGRAKVVAISESKLWAAIEEQFQKEAFTDQYAENLKGLFHQFGQKAMKTSQGRRVPIERKIRSLEAEQANLLSLYGRGIVREDLLAKKEKQIDLQIDELRREESLIRKTDFVKVIISAVQIIEQLRELPRVYAMASKEDKLRLLKGFITEIRVETDRTISFVYWPGFSSIMRTHKLRINKNLPQRAGSGLRQLAPPVGFEPTTN